MEEENKEEKNEKEVLCFDVTVRLKKKMKRDFSLLLID